MHVLVILVLTMSTLIYGHTRSYIQCTVLNLRYYCVWKTHTVAPLSHHGFSLSSYLCHFSASNVKNSCSVNELHYFMCTAYCKSICSTLLLMVYTIRINNVEQITHCCTKLHTHIPRSEFSYAYHHWAGVVCSLLIIHTHSLTHPQSHLHMHTTMHCITF